MAGAEIMPIRDILRLSDEVVAGSPTVRIRGTVTSAERLWGQVFYVQDETGGILVNYLSRVEPTPGDHVEVRGVVNVGSSTGPFAPVIASAVFEKLGIRPLPEPKLIALGEISAGEMEGWRVETEGWVRTVSRVTPSLLAMDVVSGESRMAVRVSRSEALEAERLIGSRVRLRGVVGGVRSREAMGQLLEQRLFVPDPTDLVVEKNEARDPFQRPLVSYAMAFRYRPDRTPGERVRVEGRVVFRDRNTVYLTNGSAGLVVEAVSLPELSGGMEVEAIGFPEMIRLLPVLSDSVLTARSASPVLPKPIQRSAGELRNGSYHAAYVAVEGILIDRMVRPAVGEKGIAGPDRMQMMTFVMQSQNGIFTAETVPFAGPARTDRFEVGCTLRFRGVCLSESDRHGNPAGFRVLIPSLDWAQLVHGAPFWNTERLSMALSIVMGVLLVVAGWAARATRRHAVTAGELRERNAVNAERARLAQELHDSLQQSLIGIDLQIANASHDLHEFPDSAGEHLGHARHLIKHSHRELRESIWMLRTVASDQFDLGAALERSARMLFHESGVRMQFQYPSLPRSNSALLEAQLLRIGQEALTNAFKHSRATELSLSIAQTEESLHLEIRDNGVGFFPELEEDCSHFGLQGMRERAARIGADLVVESDCSTGTCVQVKVPLRTGSAIFPQLA